MDILNESPIQSANDDSKMYQLENIDQAYAIFSNVFEITVDEAKGIVDEFVKSQKVDTKQPLCLIAYLEESKEEN